MLSTLVLRPFSRQVDPAFDFAGVCSDDFDSVARVERRDIFVSVEDFQVARAQSFEDCALGDGARLFCDEVVALATARVAGDVRRACVDGSA